MSGREIVIPDIKKQAQIHEQAIIALRRDFHEHPETSWEEVRTTEKIAEELKKLEITILQQGFKGTKSGILAELDSGKPGPTVALRADIDALNMLEEVDVEYKSKIDGKMHSCGHDSHTAMLLGAAMILVDLKDQWTGKVRFLFQPSEEAYPSGAKAMIAEGALQGIERIFGIHIFSALNKGTLLYRSGPFMAASDTWKAEIIGKGGHGSMPNATLDPTLPMAHFITGVQTIVSRELSSLDAGVVTVAGVQTSSFVNNIIPERVNLLGTCRSFTLEVRQHIEDSIKRIFAGVCQTYRCEGNFEWIPLMMPTINHPEVTEKMRKIGVELFGEENVQESPLIPGSEDFGYYLNEIPGTYMIMGAGDEEKGIGQSQHSPKFRLDESVFKDGAALHAAFVINYPK